MRALNAFSVVPITFVFKKYLALGFGLRRDLCVGFRGRHVTRALG
jgi:hypothetical protein